MPFHGEVTIDRHWHFWNFMIKMLSTLLRSMAEGHLEGDMAKAALDTARGCHGLGSWGEAVRELPRTFSSLSELV